MNMTPHPHPHHLTVNLEGGDEEVLHVRAFKKDLGIEIRIAEAKTGVVIKTRDGMYRQAIEPETQKEVVDKASEDDADRSDLND